MDIDTLTPVEATESEEMMPPVDAPAPFALRSSAKVDHILKLLSLFPHDSKTLVFSQFTGFLSLIEPHLIAAGIPYVRFDGSISQKKVSFTDHRGALH